MPRVALELAVGEGPFLKRPEPPTRSFDWPRTRSPRRPTATTSTAVPTNATSSLVWTLAGRRPTAADEGDCRSGRRAVVAGRGRSLRRLPAPDTLRGRSGADAPARLVISQRPLILATSPSAAVTDRDLAVFGST